MVDKDISHLQELLDLPKKFSRIRETQEDALTQTLIALMSPEKRFIFAELPTGTGKTLYGYLLHKLSGQTVRYLCTTLSLQSQVLNDFPNAKTVSGRRNYPCGIMKEDYPSVTAEDCPADPNDEDGPSCDGDCPYKVAKIQAVESDFAVLNMSYFLSEANYVGRFSEVPLLIVDEADTTEDALKGFIEVPITPRDLQALGVGAPEKKTKWESWKEWADDVYPQVDKKASGLNRESRQVYRETGEVDIKLSRESLRWGRLASKVGALSRHLDETWVVEHDKKWGRFTFKPTIVSPFTKQYLFDHAEKIVFMSGYLNYSQELSNLGITKKNSVFIREPSLFPAERRPIYGLPGVDLGYKNKEKNFPLFIQQLRKLLQHHGGENGVIHCVSYDIQQRIKEHLGEEFPRLLFHSSSDRKEVINKFKVDGGVIVSPSVERGEDFPLDLCRFIIITKLPYPYLGDPQVSRRLYASKDGRGWYTGKTVASVIQMAGRGVRSVEDECVTYIMASDFKVFYRKNKRLFPPWVREAVKLVKATPSDW